MKKLRINNYRNAFGMLLFVLIISFIVFCFIMAFALGANSNDLKDYANKHTLGTYQLIKALILVPIFILLLPLFLWVLANTQLYVEFGEEDIRVRYWLKNQKLIWSDVEKFEITKPSETVQEAEVKDMSFTGSANGKLKRVSFSANDEQLATLRELLAPKGITIILGQ